MVPSQSIRSIANLEKNEICDHSYSSVTLVHSIRCPKRRGGRIDQDRHTLMAGTPSLSTACVCQNPTPAVSKIASSVVSLAKTSGIEAFAKSEGGMVVVSALRQNINKLVRF